MLNIFNIFKRQRETKTPEELQQEKREQLIQYYMNKAECPHREEAIQILDSTRTMKCLMDKGTCFYTKRFGRIAHLLYLEFAGDIDGWIDGAV